MSCTFYANIPNLLKGGKEAHQWKLRRKGVGLNYHTTPEKDVCRVTPSQVERANNYGDRIHAVKHLLAMQKLGDKDTEDLRNFPGVHRVLTVIRTGSGSRDTWEMVKEVIKGIELTPPIAVRESEEDQKLHQFCSG